MQERCKSRNLYVVVCAPQHTGKPTARHAPSRGYWVPIVSWLCLISWCGLYIAGVQVRAQEPRGRDEPTAADILVDMEGHAADVSELITQLDAEQFSQRNEATRQLVARGSKCIPLLVASLGENSRETRFRVAEASASLFPVRRDRSEFSGCGWETIRAGGTADSSRSSSHAGGGGGRDGEHQDAVRVLGYRPRNLANASCLIWWKRKDAIKLLWLSDR